MTVDEIFESALERRGIEYSINEEGLYVVEFGELSAAISLDNIRRDYERDHDIGAIEDFAEQIDLEVFGEDPSWEEVRPLLRYSLEPSDYESGLEDALHEVVSASLLKVFVYIPEDCSRITWITNQAVANWGVSADEVKAAANSNMDQIARSTTLEIQDAGGVELGSLDLEETPFKASLILSPEFKSLVAPTHGWPVLVVAPARDFVFVLAKSNKSFLGRLGGVVLREYQESGHPITAEVLEVGDNGITAIGSFAPKGE